MSAGVGLGLPSRLDPGRVLASQLSQVSPMDPFSVLLAAGALLMVVASLAIYLLARRAAGVDPIVAPRQD